VRFIGWDFKRELGQEIPRAVVSVWRTTRYDFGIALMLPWFWREWSDRTLGAIGHGRACLRVCVAVWWRPRLRLRTTWWKCPLRVDHYEEVYTWNPLP